MAAVQLVVSASGLWSVAGMLAALAGLGVALGWIRLQSAAHEANTANSSPTGEDKHREARSPLQMPVSWALAPYGLLIAIVLGARLIPPLAAALGKVVLRVGFPQLATSWGWVTPAGPGRAIEVFGHAGALLLYASLLSYLLYRLRGNYAPGAPGRIVHAVFKAGLRSTAGIVVMVGMAVTMEHAGMTYMLAQGLATLAGAAFPLVSPFIGALGAFVTGSNTNSNVVFADLQQQVASFIGVNPLIILAAQTAGAAIGSAFAPAKIIVACSTVDLAGEEGQALGATMRYGLAVVALLALVCGVAVLLHL
jgi:lactate permease